MRSALGRAAYAAFLVAAAVLASVPMVSAQNDFYGISDDIQMPPTVRAGARPTAEPSAPIRNRFF
jgi:hypothetical protein